MDTYNNGEHSLSSFQTFFLSIPAFTSPNSKALFSLPKSELILKTKTQNPELNEYMEEGNANPATSTAGPAAAAQQQQHLLLQQQLFLMQQQQHQQQQQQQQRPRPPHIQQPNLQQSHLQQAMARFPSNIDAHLRAPGLRSLQFMQQQGQGQGQLSQAQLQQQMARSAAAPPFAQPQVRNPEIEMALQDASKVCNPDVKTPFSSIEDAVNRLLPYHVVSDYEAEEDDRMIEADKLAQTPSRLQQWDHNILVKIAEFTSTFEKQVLAFNIMTRKRSLGEFRSEERLHLEQLLLQNEKRLALETRAEIEARQKAAQMAASAAQADMMGAGRVSAPMRSHAAAVQGEDAQDQELMRQGSWAGNAGNSGVNAGNANENENGDNNGEEEEEGDDDYLNNEENGDDDDDDGDSGGELDLNAR
ncbi:mediator of RNA polymerase II transcription subunit-like protein [Rhynchospora pubera]|uniref:Mediator of RNA polymerase II transcription subunit-like protein n=1 Tax=Rhynchospora pubera TaxID=906938 RepID=A0AAV8FN48_9POAL|nr:mediator of RNA polymerase II transcription subunit-like protein [Rhynchospora pubera]